jgi:hypothetical protein
MRLSISTFSNPMTKLRKKMDPSSLEHRFRMRTPGMGMMPGLSSGLGGFRRTMPRLRPAMRLQGGGDINQLYEARRGNQFNPDPFARQVLAAQRALSSRFINPDMRAMPGSTAQLPYAEGGAAPPDLEELLTGGDQDESPQQDQEKQIVVEAMLALEGRHPDPQKAIERFVKAFGKDALQELADMIGQQGGDEDEDEDQEAPGGEEEEEEGPGLAVASAPDDDGGEDEEAGAAGGGLLDGPGSGQSDEIEGSTPSGRRVLLSDGEYVIDAPTVAALGDGSTKAGARRLDEFRKQVRQQAYGHDKQAKPMARGGRAVTVEFGG